MIKKKDSLFFVVGFFSLSFFLFSSVCALQLHEIYPNPLLSDATGEYIILKNNATTAVDLSSFFLKTSSSTIVLPAVLLPPSAYYFIGDDAFTKDNESWPDPDMMHTMTLRNTHGNLSLYSHADNTTVLVDFLQWASAPEGKAITHEGITEPHPLNFFQSYSVSYVPFSLLIQETTLEATFSDDLPDEGYQVYPYPFGSRSLTLMLNTTCQNLTVSWWNTTFVINKNSSLFSITQNLTSTMAPGNYTIIITGCGMQKTVVFEVLPLLGLVHEPAAFHCVLPSSLSSCNLSLTITNIGNIAFSLQITPSRPLPLWYEGKPLHTSLIVDDPFVAGEQRTLQFVVNASGLPPGNYSYGFHLEARSLVKTN